jgi:hypothetical protein
MGLALKNAFLRERFLLSIADLCRVATKEEVTCTLGLELLYRFLCFRATLQLMASKAM